VGSAPEGVLKNPHAIANGGRRINVQGRAKTLGKLWKGNLFAAENRAGFSTE
jgi:hypothetical protein